MKTRPILFAALAGSLLFAPPSFAQTAATPNVAPSLDPHANETPAQRDARMQWWRQARFGMFIHWGLYAVPAGVYQGQKVNGLGEWIMRNGKIPVAEYAAYAKQFDPEQFNAKTWVAIAKQAGMKYIVMTAKHHDGFAMYPTQVDDFHINAQTAFKRDPIGEMASECKRAGIKFGVYYSQNLDWHHPGGGTHGPSWDPAQIGDYDAYIKKVSAPQVTELISRYHPAVVWFDIPGALTPDQLRALTSSFPQDPELIFNNRLGGGIKGDTETPEQTIPNKGFPGRDWETCMTINDTWGYKTNDTNFKPTQKLLRNLIDIASKGGNYLLNVGPDSTGIIPSPEVDRLKEIGAWLDKNGDSIYATSASPFNLLPFEGRATVKGNTLYLNVFKWPANGLTLPGLKTTVKSAKVLATGEKLKVTEAADGTISLSQPAQLDAISTAIALRLIGPPLVENAELTLAPQTDGSYILKAADASLSGPSIQTQGSGDATNIGYWTDAGATAEWKLKAPGTGRYHVQIEYSCDPGSEGSRFAVLVDGIASGITATVPKTGAWDSYQTLNLEGNLELAAGAHTLEIKPLSKPGLAVMNLKRAVLVPAG